MQKYPVKSKCQQSRFFSYNLLYVLYETKQKLYKKTALLKVHNLIWRKNWQK